MRKEIGDEAEIIAWIGPHIRKDHFEVRDDVADYYRASAVKGRSRRCIGIDRRGRLALGFSPLAKEALKQAGVTEVTDCEREHILRSRAFFTAIEEIR